MIELRVAHDVLLELGVRDATHLTRWALIVAADLCRELGNVEPVEGGWPRRGIAHAVREKRARHSWAVARHAVACCRSLEDLHALALTIDRDLGGKP